MPHDAGARCCRRLHYPVHATSSGTLRPPFNRRVCWVLRYVPLLDGLEQLKVRGVAEAARALYASKPFVLPPPP